MTIVQFDLWCPNCRTHVREFSIPDVPELKVIAPGTLLPAPLAASRECPDCHRVFPITVEVATHAFTGEMAVTPLGVSAVTRAYGPDELRPAINVSGGAT